MSLHGRKMTKDKAQVVPKKFSNLLDDWIRTSAVYAFEVSILKQGDSGALRSGHMISFRHWILQSDDFCAHIFLSSAPTKAGETVLEAR
jgi:hypothetical protein